MTGIFHLFVSLLQTSRAYEDSEDDQVASPLNIYPNNPYQVAASKWLYNYYLNGQPACVSIR